MRYKILDTVIEVHGSILLLKSWEAFKSEEEPEIWVDVFLCGRDEYGMEIFDIDQMSHSIKNEDSILFANTDWSRGRIYGNDAFQVGGLIEMMLYSYGLDKGTLLFHSSCIAYQEKGVLFLGPSGIGKTTQAEIWKRYKNASILNGDLVFIKQEIDGFYAYGSPWHGSSPYYENSKVKVKMMVTLKQGSKNTVQKLSGFSVLQNILEQVFLPTWYPKGMDVSLHTLDMLLEDVPVYHLVNKADEECVELLEKVFMNVGGNEYVKSR